MGVSVELDVVSPAPSPRHAEGHLIRASILRGTGARPRAKLPDERRSSGRCKFPSTEIGERNVEQPALAATRSAPREGGYTKKAFQKERGQSSESEGRNARQGAVIGSGAESALRGGLSETGSAAPSHRTPDV